LAIRTTRKDLARDGLRSIAEAIGTEDGGRVRLAAVGA
jgi:hypothetical protein